MQRSQFAGIVGAVLKWRGQRPCYGKDD